MKLDKKRIISFIIFTTIWYLICSFIMVNLDFRSWPIYFRLCVSIIYVIVLYIIEFI